MSITVSNVATTDVFQVWLDRTNTLLEFMSNQALHANAATGVTTGNAQLVGYFGANVIAVEQIRGGNVSVSNTLVISSDVDLQIGDFTISNGDITVSGNVSGEVGLFTSGLFTTSVNSALLSVGTAFTANSTVVNAISFRVSNSFKANSSLVNATAFHVGNNFIANSTVVNAASFTVGSDVSISNNGVVTNFLTAAGLIFPTSDGSPNQAIVTDGANTLSFASFISWSTNVDNDIVPDTSGTYNFGNSSTSFATAFIDVISSVAADLNIQVQEQDVIIANTTTIDMQDKSLIGFNAGVNAQTGTSHTLTADDNGKIVTFSNNSTVTLTLENSLEAGFTCAVVQKGSGVIVFTPESGASVVNRQGHGNTAGQYAVCSLFIDENTSNSAVYYLVGDTA